MESASAEKRATKRKETKPPKYKKDGNLQSLYKRLNL